MTLVGQERFDSRSDLVKLIPHTVGRVLDVGCGPGLLGAELIKAGVAEVWGIERDPGLAEVAQAKLTKVICADLGASNPPGIPVGYFDCLVFADVLEHLIDPWAALVTARALLRPAGYIVLSIPNVRNVRVILPLIVHGRWDYTSEGILSVGHLRFFTTSTMREMIQRAGYHVEAESANYAPRGARLKRMSLGLFDDYVAQQRLFRAQMQEW